MGWWKVNGTEDTIGDVLLDALGGAVSAVLAEYQAELGRKPTKREWEAMLCAVLGNGAETGVFVLRPSELLSFFAPHFERFAARVFSGGDVIIWTATKNLWVVHHEGVFAHMRSSSG